MFLLRRAPGRGQLSKPLCIFCKRSLQRFYFGFTLFFSPLQIVALPQEGGGGMKRMKRRWKSVEVLKSLFNLEFFLLVI